MQTDDVPRLDTVGVIAAECRVPVSRIEYILRSRRNIRPAALAGNTRLFDSEGVARIKHVLTAMAARRRSR